jgi:glucosamine kinase
VSETSPAPRSVPSRAALLVDGGRSGTRLALATAEGVRPVATGPGTPLIAPADGPAAVATAIVALVAAQQRAALADVVSGRAGDPISASAADRGEDRTGDVDPGVDRPGTLIAGITGVFEAMHRAPELADRLAVALGGIEVVIASDVLTSHLGALDGAPGVVAAIGTGSIVLAVDHEGRWARADGWGPALGDAGSGYDLGRQGLVAALAARDGRGGSDALLAAARERFGPVEDLPAQLYASDNPAGLVASFTRDVAEVARTGDAVASGLWRDAADAIARSVAAASDAVFPLGAAPTVSWAGSLLQVEDLLRAPMVERLAELRPDARVVAPRGTALDGAARLLDPVIRDRVADLLHRR